MRSSSVMSSGMTGFGGTFFFDSRVRRVNESDLTSRPPMPLFLAFSASSAFAFCRSLCHRRPPAGQTVHFPGRRASMGPAAASRPWDTAVPSSVLGRSP